MKTTVIRATDASLSIGEYWNKFRFEIANERRWDCKAALCLEDCAVSCPKYDRAGADCHPACKDSCWHSCKSTYRLLRCSTLAAYDNYISKLMKYFGDKDLCDISFDDVKYALAQIQAEQNYASATVRTIQSCLSVLFRFAESRGDAYNIMKYASAKSTETDILSRLISRKHNAVLREELLRERERYHHKTKSLTVWQMEKLGKILWDSIETDGRYCLIALMLYAGIRPAEGRALFWSDIVPFKDHPDRFLVQLFKTRDAKGRLKKKVKTRNGYRRIPLHHELMRLLDKRMTYLKAQHPELEIETLPICCYGNELTRPCRDFEAAQLADQIFSEKLKLKQADMYVYMLEAEAEKLSGQVTAADQDQQLTLYVLRRNFWTWLEALTTLSDLEKRYIMGHEMKVSGQDLRGKYNDENLLWGICTKMDHCIICRQLHEPYLNVDFSDGTALLSAKGLCFIHLTKEMLAKGGTLQIDVTTQGAGDVLTLTSLSALRKLRGLDLRARVCPFPVPLGPTVGINCELENWNAHIKPSAPGERREKALPEEELISPDAA